MVTHRSRNRAASKVAAAASVAHDHDHDYSALLLKVRESFDAHAGPLFKTDADGLYENYLGALPAERQVHTCHACARFMHTYGGLATVSDNGELRAAMWSAEDVPEFYASAFGVLSKQVAKARIVAPFLSKDRIWGTPITGDWSHPAVVPLENIVYREGALTAGQAMAAKREDFATVSRALGEMKPDLLDQAIRLFEAEALPRSERFVGPIKWLRALHDRPKGRAGENLLWRAIAVAPDGFCHPRSSIAGPLLEAIGDGLSFAEIKARFDAMVHPLRYQRPQALPSAGNIKAAEVIVEKLGIARSLERRFARLEEIETVWTPPSAKDVEPVNGVFGHLASRGSRRHIPVDMPTSTFTWEKFARNVLPSAERLEYLVPPRGNFTAFLTRAHDDAPLIFKWGNPINSYVYHNGSLATQWGLRASEWVQVLAIAADPSVWGAPENGYLSGDRLTLVLRGAHDGAIGQGNALFPETLCGDLHGIRSTIEAYSRGATIGSAEGQLAQGFVLGRSSAACDLRVFVGGAWNRYHIDRWD